MSTLDTLLIGGIGVLAEEGHRSAIFKQPVAGPLHLGPLGLEGDAQADRRWHGGPERALLQVPAEHYAVWRAEFPRHAAEFVVGSFGENLSTHGMSEATVRIGARYRLGTAVIEVSQPRRPCWKLDHRFELRGLSRRVEATRRSGWLYRILAAGTLAAGDRFELLDCPVDAPSVNDVWDAWLAAEPVASRDAALAALPGLAPVWRDAFGRRLPAAR